MAKTCKKCGTTHMKADKYFHKDSTRKDGLKPYCKVCTIELNAYNQEKGKPPKDKRVCEWRECNNTFETRFKHKRFCCNNCNTKAYQESQGIEKTRFKQNFLRKLRTKKEPKPRNNKHWTFEEIEILMDKRKEGISYKEIGKLLGRGFSSCTTKHYEIMKDKNKFSLL